VRVERRPVLRETEPKHRRESQLLLQEDRDYTAPAEPTIPLEFEAFSESSQTETQYNMALFEVTSLFDPQAAVYMGPTADIPDDA
jgi:hypothetical protein